MKRSPELTVIVSTFERPDHLARCLASLERQTLPADQFEIVIADDGSRDRTFEIVSEFAGRSAIHCDFATHVHDGYRKSKALNAAIRRGSAAYLVLTDGDCIFPPDHLARHLAARRPGVVRAGNAVYLNERKSTAIDVAAIRSGDWMTRVPRGLPLRLQSLRWKSWWYARRNHPIKPKLVGNNIGVWRDQLEAINGFDERFRGWGCEDDDLGRRLRAHGARVESLLGWTFAYHLWHASDPTAPRTWREGANVEYYQRALVTRRCLQGLRPLPFGELRIRVLHDGSRAPLANLLAAMFRPAKSNPPELEILLWPHADGFSGEADGNVLVADAWAEIPVEVERQADVKIYMPRSADSSRLGSAVSRQGVLPQVQGILAQIAEHAGVEVANAPLRQVA